MLIEDFDRGLALLRRLKGLGVRISMDDFGSGYSSLSYLQAFPFDKIKIDRAFVMNLGRNPQSAAIVRAVIGLGHGLEMSIVAEGVETQEQLSFLAEAGCDAVQGYFIGKPFPIDQYDALVGRVTGDAPSWCARPASVAVQKFETWLRRGTNLAWSSGGPPNLYRSESGVLPSMSVTPNCAPSSAPIKALPE